MEGRVKVKPQNLLTMLEIMRDGMERTTTEWRIEGQKCGIGDISRYLRWGRSLGLVTGYRIPKASAEKFWRITELGKLTPAIVWIKDMLTTKPVLANSIEQLRTA